MDGFALGVLFYFFDNIKPKQITTIMSSIIVVIGDVIIVFKNVGVLKNKSIDNPQRKVEIAMENNILYLSLMLIAVVIIDKQDSNRNMFIA